MPIKDYVAVGIRSSFPADWAHLFREAGFQYENLHPPIPGRYEGGLDLEDKLFYGHDLAGTIIRIGPEGKPKFLMRIISEHEIRDDKEPLKQLLDMLPQFIPM